MFKDSKGLLFIFIIGDLFLYTTFSSMFFLLFLWFVFAVLKLKESNVMYGLVLLTFGIFFNYYSLNPVLEVLILWSSGFLIFLSTLYKKEVKKELLYFLGFIIPFIVFFLKELFPLHSAVFMLHFFLSIIIFLWVIKGKGFSPYTFFITELLVPFVLITDDLIILVSLVFEVTIIWMVERVMSKSAYLMGLVFSVMLPFTPIFIIMHRSVILEILDPFLLVSILVFSLLYFFLPYFKKTSLQKTASFAKITAAFNICLFYTTLWFLGYF